MRFQAFWPRPPGHHLAFPSRLRNLHYRLGIPFFRTSPARGQGVPGQVDAAGVFTLSIASRVAGKYSSTGQRSSVSRDSSKSPSRFEGRIAGLPGGRQPGVASSQRDHGQTLDHRAQSLAGGAQGPPAARFGLSTAPVYLFTPGRDGRQDRRVGRELFPFCKWPAVPPRLEFFTAGAPGSGFPPPPP